MKRALEPLLQANSPLVYRSFIKPRRAPFPWAAIPSSPHTCLREIFSPKVEVDSRRPLSLSLSVGTSDTTVVVWGMASATAVSLTYVRPSPRDAAQESSKCFAILSSAPALLPIPFTYTPGPRNHPFPHYPARTLTGRAPFLLYS